MASNEWKAMRVAGEEILASILAQHEEGGWEVVAITQGAEFYTAFLRKPRRN